MIRKNSRNQQKLASKPPNSTFLLYYGGGADKFASWMLYFMPPVMVNMAQLDQFQELGPLA